MSFFDAILLGILQGLTEFLPVSSSGHLVIFQKLLGWSEHSVEFDIAVHVGTTFSILTIYIRVLWDFCRGLVSATLKREINPSSRLLWLMFVGSLPTAAIGLTFKKELEGLFNSPPLVGIFLCITGLMLFVVRSKGASQTSAIALNLDVAEKVSVKQALAMGLAQGIAIAPGISRSGATIAAGMLAGIERNSAAMFSFIMSVPAILGAATLKMREISALDTNALPMLSVGLLAAYLSGLLGLWLVLKVVHKGRLEIFSYYLWIVGVLTIVWL